MNVEKTNENLKEQYSRDSRQAGTAVLKISGHSWTPDLSWATNDVICISNRDAGGIDHFSHDKKHLHELSEPQFWIPSSSKNSCKIHLFFGLICGSQFCFSEGPLFRKIFHVFRSFRGFLIKFMECRDAHLAASEYVLQVKCACQPMSSYACRLRCLGAEMHSSWNAFGLKCLFCANRVSITWKGNFQLLANCIFGHRCICCGDWFYWRTISEMLFQRLFVWQIELTEGTSKPEESVLTTANGLQVEFTEGPCKDHREVFSKDKIYVAFPWDYHCTPVRQACSLCMCESSSVCLNPCPAHSLKIAWGF